MKPRPFLGPTLAIVVPVALLFPGFPGRFAALFVILILVSGRLTSRLIRRGLSSYRICPATRLFHGEEGYVDIVVENRSRFPAPSLLLEDRPDFFLNYFGRQRFLFSLGGREKRRLRYVLRGNKRGQFLLRDWTIGGSDIFGLSPFRVDFMDRTLITVFPRIFNIRNFYTSFRQPFGEIRNRYPVFEEPTRFDRIRPYQPGDDRRRINWKLSARSGDLLVNQFTPSISQRTLLILDLYKTNYEFRFHEFYSELGLEVAASVLAHLIGMKQEAGFATHALVKEIAVVEEMVIEQEETRSLLLPPGGGDTHLTVMLGELSRCHVQDAAPPWTVFDRLDHISASSTALVLAAPDLSDELASRLLALQALGFETVVLLFGPTPRTHYPISDSGIPVWYVKREESLLELEALFG